MIRLENVEKIYPPGVPALKSINLKIERGEFVSIVGKSGAGKTTLLRLIYGEEKPTKGEVWFEELRVDTISFKDLPFLRRKIGVVFQDFKLLENKTAFENIAFILEILGKEEEFIIREVAEVLDLVGLLGRSEHFPRQLSGGEKQRVAIARAIIHRPQLLIADEPTGNLDPLTSQEIIDILLKINQMGTTVLIATHNKDIVNRLRKRVIVLEKGEIIKDENGSKFLI